MLRRAALSITLLLLGLIALPAGAEKNLMRPQGTTRYGPMVTELRALLAYDASQGAGRMTLESIGHSVKGRDIWMVTVHRDSSPVPAGSQSVPPKRVLYLCRQHGHEPASTEAALQFITQLVNAPAESALVRDLQGVTVYVVPMANPDGAEAFRRHNARDKDINRDWLHRTQPETQALYKTILRVHPDLMTDQHELYPNDTRPDFTEAAGTGSGATPIVVQTCVDTQAIVQLSMGAAGFTTAVHTVTDQHPARLAHRFGGIVAGVPTVLFETNRLSGSGRSVASRARAHLQFMAILLRDMAGERDTLLAEAAASPYGQTRGAMMLASRHKAYQRMGNSPTAPNRALARPEGGGVRVGAPDPAPPESGAGGANPAPTTKGDE